MYRMNIEEDVSSEEKMNTSNDINEKNAKVDDDTIDFTYRGPSRYVLNLDYEDKFIGSSFMMHIVIITF